MTLLDRLAALVIGAFTILGQFQLYLWCQRHSLGRRRSLEISADGWFGYHSSWVFVYTGLYFVGVAVLLLNLQDFEQLAYVLLANFLLFIVHVPFFVWFPVATPPAWRRPARRQGWSEKILQIVQRIDERSNSFPSFHVSSAMLYALLAQKIIPDLWPFVLAFPLLIALSTLYVKQHFVLDALAGLTVGLI